MKHISTIILMIGAILLSGDLMAYATFSHTSSLESRIEVESIEEGEVRGLITRTRQVSRQGYKSTTRTHELSSSFNPVLIKHTIGAAVSTTPRFIQFCAFLN